MSVAVRYVDRSKRTQCTRQHFELVARVIRGLDLEPSVATRLVAEFGRELAGTNGRFDRGRFERACGQ